MSQEELAGLIHVSVRSMSAYEVGDVIPYRWLKALSDVLNKPMAWILHGDSKLDNTHEELLEALKTLRADGPNRGEALERRGEAPVRVLVGQRFALR